VELENARRDGGGGWEKGLGKCLNSAVDRKNSLQGEAQRNDLLEGAALQTGEFDRTQASQAGREESKGGLVIGAKKGMKKNETPLLDYWKSLYSGAKR